MTRPLVSVVTPTWKRHELLIERCIPCVRAQTYPTIEHVIVSDGPDPELASLLASLPPDPRVPLRFVALGRNWSTYLTDSFCMAPSIVGDFLAQGDYLTNFADDDEMTPDHLEGLVDALEQEHADFAFGQVLMKFHDHRQPYVIPLGGVTAPQFGQITSVVYRTTAIDKSHWRLRDGMVADWALFERWMQRGARPVFVPKLTLTHYVNH